jgi:integrase
LYYTDIGWKVSILTDQKGVTTMSVLKTKNGYYQIRFQQDGKKFQKSSGSKNRAKALEIERKWRQEINDKKHLGDPDEITLYNALDLFVESKLGMKTYDDFNSKIRTIKRFFEDKPLHELTNHDLEIYVAKRKREGKAQQTIKHGLIQLKSCWAYADKLGFRVSHLVFPQLTVNNKRIRSLSKDEELRLLHELQPDNPRIFNNGTPNGNKDVLRQQRQDNYDLVVCLLDLGCRYAECAELKFEQINLDLQTVNIKRTKTNNESILMMSNRVFEILKRRCNTRTNEKWVFTDKTGKNPRKHATTSIRKAIERAGIEDFRVHDFRHTCASRMVQNGLTIQETAMILGHKSISTTMRYAHLENSHVAMKMKQVIDTLNEERV